MCSDHVTFVCRCNRDDGRFCQFCDGGLWACAVCWSFEGATTTDCPGVSLTEEQRDEIYAGTLDFRNGEWVAESSPHTPNRVVH